MDAHVVAAAGKRARQATKRTAAGPAKRPAKKTSKSISEFAATTDVRQPTKGGSWITLLPEWEEIKTAYQSGIGFRVLYEWMRQEKGYTAADLRGYDRFRMAIRYAVAA